MNINITDQIISEFMSGMVGVLAVIAVGAILSFVLRGIARKFPFTRMALVLALAPLSLINFLDRGESTALLLYAMITTLLGITIDGINHLLLPKERPHTTHDSVKQEEETAESNPSVIVWEKAE